MMMAKNNKYSDNTDPVMKIRCDYDDFCYEKAVV